MSPLRHALLVVGIIALIIGAEPRLTVGQQTVKVYRIGVLMPGFAPIEVPERSSPGTFSLTETFRQGLREQGYVEGRNLAIEWRWARGAYERLPALAEDLVRSKVDIVVTTATPAIRVAKQATGTVPIVMVLSDDPVGSGLVVSLNRPGGNVTGLSFLSSELAGKRLELLKEAVPRASRVAVLWNPANPSAERQVGAAETAARSLRVRLQRFSARNPGELDGAFAAMKRSQVGAVLVVDDPMFLDHHRQIADRATSSRFPAMYGFREFVEANGLISYGPSLAEAFLRSAAFVDKIFKGARPGELPVEQPTRFELAVNLEAAKALRLTIPQSILVRADAVIR